MNTDRISMSGLTPYLKDKLLNGKILMPTTLAALGAFTLLSAKDVKEIKNNEIPADVDDTASVEFKSNALFGIADTNLSFSDAFHSQREALGPGGVFEYKNKYFNTYLKEEWDMMTDDQKKYYFASIHKNIDNQSVVHHDMQGNTTSIKIDVSVNQESDEITVTSLTPNVSIESVTVNAGGSKKDEVIPDPYREEEDNIVDPSEIEMEEFDNIKEPSTKMEQEDNIIDPLDLEIDDIPDPSLSVPEETDYVQEPVAENSIQTSLDNAPSLSDVITIDQADFDF